MPRSVRRNTTAPAERTVRFSETLTNFEQLDFEEQRGICWDDAARAARTVAEVGRNRQLALAADLHAGHAFVPAADHVPFSERENERLAAVLARIELAALRAVREQPAGVVHGHFAAGGSRFARAYREIVYQETRWGFHGVILLIDEKLDHLFRTAARHAAGDPAVLAQRQLLALQEELRVALERHEGAVGAVVLEDPLVRAALDGAMPARGHVVEDAQAALRVAPHVDRVVVAPAHYFLFAVLELQHADRGARLRAAGREHRGFLVVAAPLHLDQADFLGLALDLDLVELAHRAADHRVEELRGVPRGDDLPLHRGGHQARGDIHRVAEHVAVLLDHRTGVETDAKPE